MDWLTIAVTIIIVGLLAGVHGLLQKIQKTLDEIQQELKKGS